MEYELNSLQHKSDSKNDDDVETNNKQVKLLKGVGRESQLNWNHCIAFLYSQFLYIQYLFE